MNKADLNFKKYLNEINLILKRTLCIICFSLAPCRFFNITSMGRLFSALAILRNKLQTSDGKY